MFEKTKGFFACSLIGVVPVELYKFCISLQNTFAGDLTRIFSGQQAQGLSEQSIAILTANFVLPQNTVIGLFELLALVAFAYCVMKIFFANIKRGGILLIQMAVGALYMFSVPRGYFEIDVPEFQRLAIQNLTPEQRAGLQFIEDTGNEIQAALTARGLAKRLKEALVLFLFALGDYAHEPGFAAKLAGCFVEGQTHAELIAAVNAAFGTDIDPDDFEKIMSFVNRQIVDVARSQLGNVGGEPYWSWYGFPSRVEWCACFVSWCADQCGYIDSGIIPRFSGCEQGVNWFQARNLWLDGSATPSSGMIIFFDWVEDDGTQDGSSDHVGIVEKVENGRAYTIEGNSGDACQQNSYPIFV